MSILYFNIYLTELIKHLNKNSAHIKKKINQFHRFLLTITSTMKWLASNVINWYHFPITNPEQLLKRPFIYNSFPKPHTISIHERKRKRRSPLGQRCSSIICQRWSQLTEKFELRGNFWYRCATSDFHWLSVPLSKCLPSFCRQLVIYRTQLCISFSIEQRAFVLTARMASMYFQSVWDDWRSLRTPCVIKKKH